MDRQPQNQFPYLGYGLGLRAPHYQYILEHQPAVDWFEILSENYFIDGGLPLHYLHRIREYYPMVMHGVSLSIGSCDPLNYDYLQRLKALAESIQPAWISDHLCWTGVDALNTHDLLPLPYTEEALLHVSKRVQQVQDFLARPILIENPSSYVQFAESQMSEWQFLTELAIGSGCFILLDINNIYFRAQNHGFDPLEYLQAIPANKVVQFHLAGHTQRGDVIVDTHDKPVIDDVWQLYRHALSRFNNTSTMVEWDSNIPEFAVLYAELLKAKDIAESVETK